MHATHVCHACPCPVIMTRPPAQASPRSPKPPSWLSPAPLVAAKPVGTSGRPPVLQDLGKEGTIASAGDADSRALSANAKQR